MNRFALLAGGCLLFVQSPASAQLHLLSGTADPHYPELFALVLSRLDSWLI